MRPFLLRPAQLVAIAARYHELLRLPLEMGWNEREQAYADDVADLLAHIAALESTSTPETPALVGTVNHGE